MTRAGVPSTTRYLIVWGLALSLLLASLAFLAAPASAAARIDSITPTAAERGAAVELRGGGFGATNVRVWVGGVSAQVLSATGNRVRFLVPETAPLGSTTVEVANPGDERASITFAVLGTTFSGSVQPIPDRGSASTASIGREGGTISTGGLTLTIPAGALSETTRITVTPLLGLNGSPLEGQVVGALFAPDGLALLEPATLSFPTPGGTTAAEILTFGFAGNGQDFHLVPHELESGIVELDVWHFSGAGGTFGSGPRTTWTPGTAETKALQELALAAAACDQTGDPTSQACAVEFPDRVRTALLRWYVDAVERGLRDAVGAPSFEVEDAITEWLRWAAHVERFGGVFPLDTLLNRLNEAEVLARKALADLTRRRLNNCTGSDLQSQLRDVIRMADLASAGAIDLTAEGLPSAFDAGLVRACARIKIDPPAFPKVAARVDANELRVRTYIGTFTGAKISTEPLALTLALTNASGDASQGVPDANGDFQTNIYPFAGTTGVIVDITVALASNALPQLTNAGLRESLGSSERVNRFARNRIELDPLGASTTVNAGGSAALKVRVAGNGMENATVDYTVTGQGTLSVASGVTNQDGEAPTFDYTAPANPSAMTATVTATLGSDEDSVTFTITNIQVTVSPSSISLSPGQTTQFTATVTGTSNTAVTWTATGGAITSSGLYTADSTPGTFAATATSVADPTISRSATIVIQVARGVARNSSRGAVAASCFGTVLDPSFLFSPPGATNWSDELVCTGEGGASGRGSTIFVETYANGTLIGADAAGVAEVGAGTDPNGFGTAAGRYELDFQVAQPTRVTIIGGLVCGDPSLGYAEALLTSFATGVVVRRTCADPDFSTVLPSGRYILTVEAVAGSSEGNGRPSGLMGYGVVVSFAQV